MNWILTSKRLARSTWWNTVNREEVQGPLTAWQAFDKGKPPSSRQHAYYWYKYITARKIDPYGSKPSGYYGGNHRQLWAAHQKSLWAGIAKAARYLNRETEPEQLLIFKVVANVETYARFGIDLDAYLDGVIRDAKYPKSYPATKRQACQVAWPRSLPPLGAFVGYSPALEKKLCK
jgi:hypothetical protein